MLGVNRSGSDPRGLSYAGASAVYDPLGEAVLELGSEQCIGAVTINLQRVKDIRDKLPFLQDADEFELKMESEAGQG